MNCLLAAIEDWVCWSAGPPSNVGRGSRRGLLGVTPRGEGRGTSPPSLDRGLNWIASGCSGIHVIGKLERMERERGSVNLSSNLELH